MVSTVTDLGAERTIRVRSRYLIGCDGASSRVRRQLGIEMHGPPLIQCYLMIHFAADLRALTADRPAVLHFVLDPACTGAFVAHDVDSDWVFMHAVDPGAESVDDYPPTGASRSSLGQPGPRSTPRSAARRRGG